MSREVRGPKDGRSSLTCAIKALKSGRAEDILECIQKWTNISSEEPSADWDMIIGAALWHRCTDQKLIPSEEELSALETIYKCLISRFLRTSQTTENYMERCQVFAATFKFLVAHKRVDIEIIENLLQEVSKTSFYVRQNDFTNFRSVCLNFYALLWNYMRENQQQFNVMQSLDHASLSVRWLVILGLDQFQNISNKLAQISVLLVKTQMRNNNAIAEFFINLAHKITDLMKQTVIDDSRNGVKVKKTKAVLPVSNFYGLLNITFVLTRQLVLFGDYEKAIKVFRPITSVAKVFFDTELTELWKKILEAYVKISIFMFNGVDAKITEDLSKSSESFRECRKQILDVKFQKAYPGYAFSFMYAFTECIGSSISNSKNFNVGQEHTPLLRQMPLSRYVKFLKEIQLAADACVGLDNTKIGKHVLESITEARKIDIESTTLFHVLKYASERIADKEEEIDKDLQQITEACFSTLLTLSNRTELDNNRAAELFNLLTFHTCNLGFAYQKRKNYKEAMSWCNRSIDAFEAFQSKDTEIELKIHPLSVGLLLADCHRQLEDYVEGLRWLSKWLFLSPQCLSQQSNAYDIYEQIPWTDWSVHWQGSQKEICLRNPADCRTAVDYLEEHDPSSVSDMFASRVLRLEMNAYFSGRQTVVPAILGVGRKLVENNFCVADTVLGQVCQAVGLWWVSSEESLNIAITLLEEATVTLDQTLLNRQSCSRDGEDFVRMYLSGLVFGWRGLCVMKMKQSIAEAELEALTEKHLQENPEKSRDKAERTYAVSGFTSLTIQDEIEWTTLLSQSAECFYVLSQMEDVFKSITESHCPALAQITVRLVALSLSVLGDKISSVKGWFSTFTIAKLYDRRGLIVLAASEILKILPCTTLECVQYADKVNQTALEGNLIKHNKAVYYRLDLAKAAAHYHNKNYREGLQHLAAVYTFLSQKDNFDSTHHVMAEADYILSLYRSVDLNQNLEFPDGIPEMLCKMTPAGLAVKGYKLLGSLSREIDVVSSGWTDIFHNFYLLGSMADLCSRTVKLLKETGKLRDLKCFITDAVYFMQRLGVISRSVSVLLPLIETDISARNFYMAQIRMASIANVLLSGSYRQEEDAPPFTEAKRFLENHMKIPGLTINRLENVSNLKWHVGDIEVSSFHYRNRSSKYLSSLKKDCESINIQSIEMKAPAFMRHPLSCACYTCVHLEIIPTSIEFLTAQAKYAVAMKWKISMAVLELARLHHQRAMFRILFNMEYFSEQLQAIVPKRMGMKLLQIIYAQFFFKPGFQMQLTNTEICPVGDIAHLVQLTNSALRAAEILDNQDYVLKALALEVGTSALYEYFCTTGRIPIHDGNVRQILRTLVDQQEKENTQNNASPDILETTILPIAPPVLRKRAPPAQLTKQQQHGRKAKVTLIRPRRILNNKVQQQQELFAEVELIDLTKVDNLEDRHVPVIPPPNFDDSNDD